MALAYKQHFNDLKSCLVTYATVKGNMLKHNSTAMQRELWDAVPVVSADSKWGDIVKDYSVDERHGHVGVVSDTQRFTKRDGTQAIRVWMQFINHTTVNHSPDIKTRKLVFVIPTETNNQ